MVGLKTLESLRNLDVLLGHLDVSKRNQLTDLMSRFPCLFGDTPTRPHVVDDRMT